MSFFEELLDNDNKDESEDYLHTSSITTGIVKENWNAEYPGMVKVELILGETGQKTTEWIRVTVPYGGNGFGEYFLPEVNSEVVVAFNMGDINCPIVIGCLWSNKDKLPEKTANEKNSIKKILTKGGHEIIFDDDHGKENIQIHTPGNLKISLQDEKKLILISDSSGKNQIIIDGETGGITITGKSKISLEAGSGASLILDGDARSAEIKADNINLKAVQAVNLKGLNLKIEGDMTEVLGKASFKAESSGIMALKGSLVKIN